MKFKSRAIASSILAIAYGAFPYAAMGQESSSPDAAESVEIPDIVVTAQKREQRLQDVPVSVTVTSGALLQQANINTLSDLSTRLPNVRMAAAPSVNLLFIRGVGSGVNTGFEQAVGTFVDGVYRGRSRSTNAGLFDLERIEVLKGPQTTFFGNNVIAGALNIITRKPGSKFEYNASALYSPDDGEYALEAGVSVPLSDKLSFRLAGKALGMDGYLFNETTQTKVPHQRGVLLRGSALWEPTDRWRTDLRVDWGRQRNKGEPATEGVNCPPDVDYGAPRGTCLAYINSGQTIDDEFDYHINNIPTKIEYDYVEVALTNSLDVGDGTISSVSGYFHHKAQNLNDLSPFPTGGVGGTPSGLPTRSNEKVSQYSQELRFTSAQDGVLSYMFGGYYAREELRSSTYAGFYFAPFGARAAPTYSAATPIAFYLPLDQDTDTWSAFASVTLRPTENLQADFGVRYTNVNKVALRDLQFGQGGNIPGPGAFTAGPIAAQNALAPLFGGLLGNFPDPTRTDDKLMPSVKVQYKFSPDVMVYASYTLGFKAGGFSATPTRDIFSPEGVDAYEIGAKGTFLDRRLFLSLAAFLSDYSDLQETTQVPLSSGAIVALVTNAAGARAKGVEFSMNFRMSPRLSINADIAYLDAHYTNYSAAPCTILGGLTPNCVQDMSGKKRGFSPKFSGNFGFTASAPLTDEVELRFNPSVYFTTKYFQSATADPLLSQKGYAKIDARIGIGPADQRWEIAVIGKNLADKHTAAFRQPFGGTPGSIFLYPERPRSIAIQASIKY
ncbi:TonB-dependent receptor [Sphingobium ummariense]